jgi:hypothetical protein
MRNQINCELAKTNWDPTYGPLKSIIVLVPTKYIKCKFVMPFVGTVKEHVVFCGLPSLCPLEDKWNFNGMTISNLARVVQVVPVMGEEAQRKLNIEKCGSKGAILKTANEMVPILKAWLNADKEGNNCSKEAPS